MICVSHPGKIGDALYTLPTIRELSKIHNCKVDFYTSSYCLPIKKLFEFQECINEVIIPEIYTIQRYDLGIQPAEMPIRDIYEKAYQLGFTRIPDKSIPEFIAETAGLDRNVGRNIKYEVPEHITDEKYYVVAPRGDTSFKDLFWEICKSLSQENYVYIIGGKGENPFILTDEFPIIDATGNTYLEMASLIAHANGFIGIMSSPLVLANGFSIPKYIPYNSAWDMRHIVNKNETLYSNAPSVMECMQWMRGGTC